MSLVSPTQVSDGTTADAADINTPVNQLAAVINGNIDDNNINTTANIQGSKIATSTITNTQMSTEVKPVTRTSEGSYDFVASGCVWTGDAYASTLLASMTAGVVYISGVRIAVSAVTARAFTASKDTYIDVDSTGTVTYTDNTINAASPALAAGSIRIGIIVTGASAIAAVAQINQGQETKIVPIASSIPYQVTDSLGNLICPRDPNRKILGYRQILGSFTTSSTSAVQITGLTCPVIVPTNRKIRVTIFCYRAANNTNNTSFSTSIWDGTVGSGTQIAGSSYSGGGASNVDVSVTTTIVVTPATASKTYNAGLATSNGASSQNFQAGATLPSYIMVELV